MHNRCTRSISKLTISKPLRNVFSSIFLLYASQSWAVEQWSYLETADPSTNRSYSIARSPLPRRDLYDDLRLELVCKDNKLLAVIDSDILIASQGSNFDVEYQIDKQAPVKIQMRTFPDSKRKGYNDAQAKTVADALLSGQSVFIRVTTMIRRVLSGSIPLDGVVEPVKHVLADCGGVTQNQAPVTETPYSLTDFEQAFGQLSPAQQQRILSQIQKLMAEPQ